MSTPLVTISDKAKANLIDEDAVLKLVAETRAKFESSPGMNKVNVLLMGYHGTRKTTFLTTAPKPIHIDIFDKGGAKTAALKPFIKSGEVIIDNRWEADKWKTDFSLFHQWETQMLHRIKTGYFNAIGTYCLDGSSTFGDSIMWTVLRDSKDKRGKRGGTVPDRNDFAPMQYILVGWLSHIVELPCHVIVTGHMAPPYKDELSKIDYPATLLLAGKSQWKVPLAFDEKWIAKIQGSQYVIQTKPMGLFHAQTRIGSTVFELNETPDFKALLKKAGYNDADNPDGMRLFVKGGIAQPSSS